MRPRHRDQPGEAAMALIKWGENLWDPFRELAEWPGQTNRMLGKPFGWMTKHDGGQWVPEVDIAEEKDRIIVKADLPGMTQDEISVELSNGIVTIKGERKRETESKEGKTYRTERAYGSFVRSFTLPAGVEASKAVASYRNGVLELILPKMEEAKTKEIHIEVN